MTKKRLNEEGDRTWRTKGGGHKVKERKPIVCPACNGLAVIHVGTSCIPCEVCGGTGEFDEY